MGDLSIRIEGRAGRITLTRPKALNALSHEMSLAIEAALAEWATDDRVAVVILDAEGERAFCAGGDIATIYETGRAGDFDTARQFWADEYRLNAAIATYAKPVAAFMQGFTMGGGVGLGGHAGFRVVGESSQIAMPETGIGLIPDVGGTFLLARSPGRLGEYLGLTGARMGPGDAILAGFADHFIPEERWPEIIKLVQETGDMTAITVTAAPLPDAPLAHMQPEIDMHFGHPTVAGILESLASASDEFAGKTHKALSRVSPLAAQCALELIAMARDDGGIIEALEREYRATFRSAEHGDLLEGIRAQIIDKDRNPAWKHKTADEVTAEDVEMMLAPLGANTLKL